ncbi:MAG TPA: hypothetical protein VGZ22_18085 [Isosphaeraceae bacterium]|nr:hypothetical protein [Isosphaeraceae bacterium]
MANGRTLIDLCPSWRILPRLRLSVRQAIVLIAAVAVLLTIPRVIYRYRLSTADPWRERAAEYRAEAHETGRDVLALQTEIRRLEASIEGQEADRSCAVSLKIDALRTKVFELREREALLRILAETIEVQYLDTWSW